MRVSVCLRMWLSRLCLLQTSPQSLAGLTLCLAESGLTFSACSIWTGPLTSHHGPQPQGVVPGFPQGRQKDGSSSKLQGVFWSQETSGEVRGFGRVTPCF